MSYLGHIISAEGISPDKEKVRAIAEMPPPEDKKGFERLLYICHKSHKIHFCKAQNTTQFISDNSPQFSAEEYKAFTKEWGIKHITSSPHYPQANGLAEKYVQVVK